ncbi:transposase zinc-binding domain-containing protein [Paenibacillus sp. HWE-109]|nr:transposase zinc-binding domain-containing protein [Paenibacillus sp. HWE-109]UKS29260.1 transposase zinc-binding domain-containing protein [Paenibacillus sp. HWE-109]
MRGFKGFSHYCGDPKKGFKLLACEGCHDLKVVSYRCQGRFCTTCSCGETEERLQSRGLGSKSPYHDGLVR